MSSSAEMGSQTPRKVGHDVLFELKSTRWWFQICFIFTPIWGKIPNLTIILQRGLKPSTSPGLQEHNNVSEYLLRFGQYIKQDTVNIPSVDAEAVSKQNCKK